MADQNVHLLGRSLDHFAKRRCDGRNRALVAHASELFLGVLDVVFAALFHEAGFHRAFSPQRGALGLHVLFGEADDLVVIHAAGDAHDEMLDAVLALVKIDDAFSAHALDRLFGPEDGFTERLIGVDLLVEFIEDRVFELILGHEDLLDDDLLFFFYVGRIELRPADEIAQDVERKSDVLGKCVREEARILARRERVEVASDRFHVARDFVGRSIFGSFENKVLDEVSEARLVVRFVACAFVDPDSDGDRAVRRMVLGQNRDAAVEHGLFISRAPDSRFQFRFLLFGHAFAVMPLGIRHSCFARELDSASAVDVEHFHFDVITLVHDVGHLAAAFHKQRSKDLCGGGFACTA